MFSLSAVENETGVSYEGHVVGLKKMGESIILEVFSNLNDSMISLQTEHLTSPRQIILVSLAKRMSF